MKGRGFDQKVIRLLIVDDHPMVREGIRLMLQSPSVSFLFEIKEAENGEEAIRIVRNRNFEVVMIDYQMPGMCGDQVIRDMLLYRPALKILAVSNYDGLAYIRKMMAAGAKGYVLKNIEPPELIQAIKTILKDKIYYSNEVASRLLESSRDGKNALKAGNRYQLTPREMEVLQMIAEEKTNEEIASQLNISRRTIDTHRQRILQKVGAKNTAGLIKAAFELKLIEIT